MVRTHAVASGGGGGARVKDTRQRQCKSVEAGRILIGSAGSMVREASAQRLCRRRHAAYKGSTASISALPRQKRHSASTPQNMPREATRKSACVRQMR